MKKLFTCAVFLAFFILVVSNLRAQNYQPFRKGLTYHFLAQDSIYSLRVDSAKVVGGDSVFVFNRIARKGGTVTKAPCFPTPNGFGYAIHENNQFGNKMLKKANGDYIFRTKTNQDFILKTKVAVGASWAANVNPTITATLTSKTLEQVLGVTDSVMNFTLSNGKILKLSKQYGFLKAPNFISYTDSYFRPKDLDLYALPEKSLGHAISSPFAVYNFQPADKFLFHEDNTTLYGSVCWEEWTEREVLTRRISPNGDTIYYTLREQKLRKSYGSPSAPAGFCQAPAATTLSPARTYSLVISPKTEPLTNLLSQSFYTPLQSQSYAGMVSNGIFKKPQYNLREQMRFINYPYDSCAQAYKRQLDSGSGKGYAVGLGEVYRYYFSMGELTLFELQAYIKGTETYGTWQTLAQIMAVKEMQAQKPLVKAFPNPFSSELSIMFGETSGKAQLTLRNTLGQLVWQQETTATANSELKLKLPELPKGLYILQTSQNGKSYTSRLVKE